MKNGRNRKNANPCRTCKPDNRFRFLQLKDVMELQTDSDQIFSLKTYAVAFTIVMQDYPEEDVLDLLESCRQEIARGHTLEIHEAT